MTFIDISTNQSSVIEKLKENEDFVSDCIRYAYTLGIVTTPPELDHSRIAPIALVPSLFPKVHYESATSVVGLIHRLVDSLTMDPAWLVENLNLVSKEDEFTSKLLGICKALYIDGGKGQNPLRLHLLREDYLLASNDRILQVEVNCIASAFTGLIEPLSILHKMVCKRVNLKKSVENKPLTRYANAIHLANEAYCRRYQCKSPQVVLFIVEQNERNSCDQYALEVKLLSEYNLTCSRKSLESLTVGKDLIVETDGRLTILHNESFVEVSIVYYRAGYGPQHYPTENCWKVRETLEVSNAINCPSVCAQLVGTKKVQQLWFTNPEDSMVSHGKLTKDQAFKLKRLFAIQVDPSLSESKDCILKAIDNPEDWVLKPQREGGGNNLYGEEMTTVLNKQDQAALSQYVLMERMIDPNPTSCLVIDVNTMLPRVINESVSELGIYSAFLVDGSSVILNDELSGHMLRTKDKTVCEGGVNAGFSSLSTPLFY